MLSTERVTMAGEHEAPEIEAMARAAFEWLFPDGTAETPVNRNGAAAFDSRDAIENALRQMPAKLLAGLAAAPTRYTHAKTLGAITFEANCWLTAMLPSPSSDANGALSAPLRDLGNLLVFSDLLEALRDSDRESFESVSTVIDAYSSPRLWGQGRTGPVPPRAGAIPAEGYLYAAPDEVANARAFVVWYLLIKRLGFATVEVPPEAFAFIRGRMGEMYRLIDVAIARTSMNPQILAPILDSETPVLAEGWL